MPAATSFFHNVYIDTARFSLQSIEARAEFWTSASSSSFAVEDPNYPFLRWFSFDCQKPRTWVAVRLATDGFIENPDMDVKITLFKYATADTSLIRNIVVQFNCENR
jgi:hypothetical protein